MSRPAPTPRCPLRPGEACTLCEPGASGPEDCPAVYLVHTDPDLRARWQAMRRTEREAAARHANDPISERFQ
ncbi:MAG: hypothetical protein HOQ45_08185 [Nocardioidaceae bacterium]|nr:hypothetical protein [Nocardioidaceae bacterium]